MRVALTVLLPLLLPSIIYFTYVALAREHGLDPAQMALAYVSSRPFLTSNIIGATTLEQLDSNLASLELTLSDTVLLAIEQLHAEQPNPAP